MEVDVNARASMILVMQYPSEITGLTISDFLRSSFNASTSERDEFFLMKFIKEMDGAFADVSIDQSMAQRYLNEGFSGGEKKRNEILQLLMLQSGIAILDEIDSGLDIDALKVVAEGVNKVREKTGLG